MAYSVIELTGKGPYYIQIENKQRKFIKEMTGEIPRKGDFISLRTAQYTETIFKVKAVHFTDILPPAVLVKRVHERKY